MNLQRFMFIPVLLAAALPGFAELGGNEQSVARDQAIFQAARTVAAARGSYEFHEMSRADGMVIRHYVNPQGKVFGVSWSGPTIPDLSQLLGSHYAEFRNKPNLKTVRRRAASFDNGDLVVESSGHMRAFFGRAYLASELPAGVAPEIIQ
jgi:hypothetical protein